MLAHAQMTNNGSHDRPAVSQRITHEKLIQDVVLEEMRAALKEQGLLDTLRKHQGLESTEHLLARFLKARKGSVKNALKLLKDDLSWREEEDILGLRMSSATDVLRGKENPAGKEMHDYMMPSAFLGHDKLGRAVMYCEVGGKFNANKLESEGKLDQRTTHRFQWWLSERVFDVQGQSGQALWIVDVGGFHVSQITSKKNFLYMKAICDVAAAHYPERMGRTIIINAPKMFAACWRVCKPLLDHETQVKIDIMAGKDKWLPEMERFFDTQILPKHLGGEKELCFAPHSLDPELFQTAQLCK